MILKNGDEISVGSTKRKIWKNGTFLFDFYSFHKILQFSLLTVKVIDEGGNWIKFYLWSSSFSSTIIDEWEKEGEQQHLEGDYKTAIRGFHRKYLEVAREQKFDPVKGMWKMQDERELKKRKNISAWKRKKRRKRRKK